MREGVGGKEGGREGIEEQNEEKENQSPLAAHKHTYQQIVVISIIENLALPCGNSVVCWHTAFKQTSKRMLPMKTDA